MTETFTAFYLKVCPYLYRFADCPAMVTDTYVFAWVDTVAIGEVISRHHLLQVYHTRGVFSQSGSHTDMVCVRLFVPSADRSFLVINHRQATDVSCGVHYGVMRPSTFAHRCPKTGEFD